jgi:hypothetical protein
MNRREKMKQDLTALGLYNPGYLTVFRRMYSNTNLITPISDVVDNMPDSKLTLAASQIQNTLDKHKEA